MQGHVTVLEVEAEEHEHGDDVLYDKELVIHVAEYACARHHQPDQECQRNGAGPVDGIVVEPSFQIGGTGVPQRLDYEGQGVDDSEEELWNGSERRAQWDASAAILNVLVDLQ